MHRSGRSTPGGYGSGISGGGNMTTPLTSDMMAHIASQTNLSQAETMQSLPNIDFQNLNISFNGCGFLGIYHVGVATALRTYVPNFRIENVCGASAGALAAVCLIGNVPTGMTCNIARMRMYQLL